MKQRLTLALVLIVIASMVLTGCGGYTTRGGAAGENGAWVDKIVFSGIDQAEAALTQLQAGEIDVYAYSVNDPKILEAVRNDPNLAYTSAFGSFNEITYNPAKFTDGRLNPFTNPKIREATNWLYDRNYVAQEIFGGLAVPKFTILNSSFADYARYVDVSRAIEAKYAYNLDKAKEIITAEMEGMGATLVDGKWTYQDAPVTLAFLIRTEDERKDIGDYVANQLEAVGFTVDRQYKTRSEASPIWVQSDPAEGQWNLYTGGWITTAISRDDGSNFSFYYTPNDYPIPLFQAYTPTPEFNDIALKLRNNDFKSMKERGELFAKALPMSVEDSVRVWIVDQISFSPQVAKLQVTYDLAGGVAAAQMAPYTIRFKDAPGGTVRWAQPGVLIDPWNPIAGSNWVYDTSAYQATGDRAILADPYTGLAWPQRIEKADVVAQTGLPISKTLDWVTLSFQDKIDVPADAWADWDAAKQEFVPAGDGLTAKVKVTVTYPKSLYDIRWHDGSKFSAADVIMAIIMQFDPGKQESKIYDEAAAANLEAFKAHFKAVKVVSTDPLVIETYDDLYALDAENNVTALTTWFPYYTYGMGAWHNIALGVFAEEEGKLAFSTDKATANEVEWTSFIAGPSLEILKGELDAVSADGKVPYATTLGKYVTANEAKERYANLAKWYTDRGHFWIGTGPFYLESVAPVEGSLTLARWEKFPDKSDKWARFASPKIAVVDVTGPTEVKIGSEATFDVAVTYAGAAYPQKEISGVKFLLFDSAGTLITTGEAKVVEDGKYQIVLPADVTSKLAEGSCKLEVAVTSLVVSVPSFGVVEFVAAP
jgi:peptide/nickel transport system substrate-binding protein